MMVSRDRTVVSVVLYSVSVVTLEEHSMCWNIYITTNVDVYTTGKIGMYVKKNIEIKELEYL